VVQGDRQDVPLLDVGVCRLYVIKGEDDKGVVAKGHRFRPSRRPGGEHEDRHVVVVDVGNDLVRGLALQEVFVLGPSMLMIRSSFGRRA